MGSTTKMTKNIIFYDGYCVVCSRFIRFLIKTDKKKIYSFANIPSKISDKILRDKKLADAYKSLETIHDTYGRVIGNDAIQLRQRLEQMLKQDVKKKVLNWDEVWSTL